VAPRIAPDYWLPRTAALFLASWALVVALTLSWTLLPLAVGRSLFSLAMVPRWLWHDPLCYLSGMVLCGTAMSCLRLLTSNRRARGLYRAATRMPRRVIRRG
jgi:hypothetical protein